MPTQSGGGAVTIRRPDGGILLIPQEVVATRDPAQIRQYLTENGAGDLPVTVRPLTGKDFEGFAQAQATRANEVQRGMNDVTDEQGFSPFARAIDESPIVQAARPFLNPAGFLGEAVGQADDSGGGFLGGLTKLAKAVTPDWGIGRRFSEATGITPGKVVEQLTRGWGQLAGLTGSAALAGADAMDALPPWVAPASQYGQRLIGEGLRGGAKWLTDMMEVPGAADLGEVRDTYNRAGLLPAALGAGELMARGITENYPQMMAGSFIGPARVAAGAAPLVRYAANLAPFAVTAMPQETGDIYERAIDEGRQGPQAALAALAGGAVNALAEAGPEAFQARHLLGQQLKRELRQTAGLSLRDQLIEGAKTALKSTLGEAGTEMGQEGVGYAAERAGGAEPSTYAELGNRIGTAGLMSLGMGLGMGVPSGGAHIQAANRFAEGQARLPQIQQQIDTLGQMRTELLGLRDRGVEEINDAQGRPMPVDYLLGRLDTQLDQHRQLQAEHISAFGEEGTGLPPNLPPPISQTADQAMPQPPKIQRQPRVRVQPVETPTEAPIVQPENNEVVELSPAEEPAPELQELPSSLDQIGQMRTLEELQAAPITLVEEAAQDLARIGGQRINEGRPILPGDPEHQLAQILRDELARREALPADHPANQRETVAPVAETPAVAVAELRAKIERVNRGRRVKTEPASPTAVKVEAPAETPTSAPAATPAPTPVTAVAPATAAPKAKRVRKATETPVLAPVQTTPATATSTPAAPVTEAKPSTYVPSPTEATQFRAQDALAEAKAWKKAKLPTRMRMLRNNDSTLKGLTYEEADRATKRTIADAEAKAAKVKANPKAVAPRATDKRSAAVAEQTAKVKANPKAVAPRATDKRSAAVAEQTAKLTGELPAGSPAAAVAEELGGQIADASAALKDDLTDLTLKATKTLNVVAGPSRSTSEILLSLVRNIMRLGHLKFRAVALRVREELAKAHGQKVAEDVASLEQLKRAYLAVTRALSPASRVHVSPPEEVAAVTVLPPPSAEQEEPAPEVEAQPAPKAVAALKFSTTPRTAKPEEEVTDRRLSDAAFEAWKDHELADIKDPQARTAALLGGIVQVQLGLPTSAANWKRTIPPGYAKVGDRLVMTSRDPGLTTELSEKDKRDRDLWSGKKFDWASDMGWSGLGDRATQSLKLGAAEGGGTVQEKTLKAIEKANAPGGLDDQRVKDAGKVTAKARKSLEGVDRLTEEPGPVIIDLSHDGFVNDRMAVTDEQGNTTSVDTQSHQLESALQSLTDDGTDSPWMNQPIPLVSRPTIEGEIEKVEKSEGDNPKILEIQVRIPGAAGEGVLAPGVDVVREDGDDLIVRVSPMRLISPEYLDALSDYDRALISEIHARRMQASHSRLLLRAQRGDSQFEAITDIPSIPEDKLKAANTPEKAVRVLRQHQKTLLDLRKRIAEGSYVAAEDRTISVPFSLEAIDHSLIELDDRIAQLQVGQFMERDGQWLALHRINPETLTDLMSAAATAERDDTATSRSRLGAVPAPDDAEMERLNALPDSKGMSNEEKTRWKYARLRLKFREPARQALRLSRQIAELQRWTDVQPKDGPAATKIKDLVAERQPYIDLLNDVALNRAVEQAQVANYTAGQALNEAVAQGEQDADVMEQLQARKQETQAAFDAAVKRWNEESNEASSARADAIAIGQGWMGNSASQPDSKGDSYGVSGMNVGPADRGRRMRRLMAGLPTRTRVKALWYGTELARRLETPKGPWREVFRKSVRQLWNASLNSVRQRSQREVMDDLNAMAVATQLVAHHFKYDTGAGISEEMRSAGILYGLVKRGQRHLATGMEVTLANMLVEDSAAYFTDVAGRQAEARNEEADHSNPAYRPYYQLPSPVPISDAAAVEKQVRPLVEPNWRVGEEQRTSASVSRKWVVLRIAGNADGTQGELVFLPIKWTTTNGQENQPATLRIRAPFNLGGQQRRKGAMVPLSELAARGGLYGNAQVVGMVTLSPGDGTDRFPLGDHPVHQWSIQPVLDQWHNQSERLGEESQGGPLDLSRIVDHSDPEGIEDEMDRTAMGASEPATALADIDRQVREDAVQATRRLLAYFGERMHMAGLSAGATQEGVRQFLLDLISEPDSRFMGALSQLYDSLTTAGSAPNGGTLLGQSMTEGVFYDQFHQALIDAANEYAADTEVEGQPDETGKARRRIFSADPVAGLGQAIARKLGVSAASGALPASDTNRGAGAAAEAGLSPAEADLTQSTKHERSAVDVALQNEQQRRSSQLMRSASGLKWVETAKNQPRQLMVTTPEQIAALERIFGGSTEDMPTIPSWWRITPLRGGGYQIRDYLHLGLELIRPQTILPRPVLRSTPVEAQRGQRVGPYLTEDERAAMPVDEEAAARYGREYADQLRRSREQVPTVGPMPRVTGETAEIKTKQGKVRRVRLATLEEGGTSKPATPDVYGAPPSPTRARLSGEEIPQGTPRRGQNVVAEPESPETVAANRRMAQILSTKPAGVKKNESRTVETQSEPSRGRTPLTAEEVAQHVRQMLGVDSVPAHIQIVDGLTGQNGLQIAGDYNPATGEIRLNSRLIYDSRGVARTLVHEGAHAVFDDPEVQSAVGELRQSLPEDIRRMVDALYGDLPEAARSEEGIVTLAERIANEAPKSALMRVWQAIKDAMARIPSLRRLLNALGVDTTDSLARQIAAHALVGLANPIVRQSKQSRESRLTFNSEDELNRAKANTDAQSQDELERQAQAQATTIPDWAADRVRQWKTPGIPMGKKNPTVMMDLMSRRRAARSLDWLVRYNKLSTDRVAVAQLWADANALPDSTEDEREAKARAQQQAIVSAVTVLDVSRKILYELQQSEEQLQTAQANLDRAIDEQNAANAKDRTRSIAAVATMTQDLEEWAEANLEANGTDEQMEAERKLASELTRMDGADDDFNLLIERLFNDPDVRTIVDDPKLTDSQKLSQLLGGPIPLAIAGSKELQASPFIRAALTPSLPGGMSPLGVHITLPSQLAEIFALRRSKELAKLKVDDIVGRNRGLSTKGNLDLRKFAARLVREAEKLGEAKQIRAMAYREVRQANIQVMTAARKIQLLEQLSLDPAYREHVRQAWNLGQPRNTGLLMTNRSGMGSQRDPSLGKEGTEERAQQLPLNSTSLVMPDTGETLIFRHSFKRADDDRMRAEVAKAIRRIGQWVAGVDSGAIKDVNPTRVEEYRGWVTAELLSMLDPGWAIAHNQTWGTVLSAVFHNPQMTSLLAPFGPVIDPLTTRLGGQFGRNLRRDIAGFSRMTSESYGLLSQLRAEEPAVLNAAVKSHGIELDPMSDVPLRTYYYQVLNPIVAQGQWNQQRQLKVGDEIKDWETGAKTKVTAEDLRLVMLLKRWHDQLRATVETPGSAIERRVAVEVPGGLVSRGQQGPQTQRTVTQGPYTTSRTPSPQLRELLDLWSEDEQRMPTRGTTPAGVDDTQAAEMHWQKYFATDRSTNRPRNPMVWGRLLIPHLLTDDPDYVGHRRGIGEIYTELRNALRGGWEPQNAEQLLEKLGRAIKRRELARLQDNLARLSKVAGKGMASRQLLEARQALMDAGNKTDAQWAEDGRVLLANDIQHAMGMAGQRYGAKDSAREFVSRISRDEFNTPRGALLVPSTLMSHLPIDQGAQNMQVAAAVDHFMSQLKLTVDQTIQGITEAINEHEKLLQKGAPIYTGAGKRNGEVMHTIRELARLRTALSQQSQFLGNAMEQTFDISQGAAQWVNLLIRGGSSLVLNPLTNAPAVTRDVLVTSGVFTPLATLGLGNSFVGVALAQTQNLGRATAGVAKRLAATQIGRRLGTALPFVAQLAVAYERNRAALVTARLAEHRMGLETVMDAMGGPASTSVARRAITGGKLGAKDEQLQQRARAVTQWLYGMRVGTEEATNLLSALEGWRTVLKKLKRKYRQAMEERLTNGVDQPDPTIPGFEATADELFDHHLLANLFFDRRDSHRNMRDLFAETRGLDLELREWYERTRGMTEDEALKEELNDLAETATARRWIAMYVRPSVEQLSLGRLAKGPLGRIAQWGGMHKGSIFAVRASFGTHLGRSTNPNMWSRNLKVLGGTTLGLIAAALGMALAYEVPRLEKKMVSGVGSASPSAAEALEGPEVLGRYLSQVVFANTGLFPSLFTLAMGANLGFDPMSMSDQMFGMGVIEDLLKAGARTQATGTMDAAMWLARRRVPLVNHLMFNFDGSAEATTLYRAYQKLAPEELGRESYLKGSLLGSASPESLLAREAANARIAGDEVAAERAKQRLITFIAQKEQDILKAEREAESKIGNQMPMRRALKRRPTEDEQLMLFHRLNPEERRLMQREIDVTRRRR